MTLASSEGDDEGSAAVCNGCGCAESVVGLEANLLIHLSAGVLRKVHLCQVNRAQVTLSSSGYILLRKDTEV